MSNKIEQIEISIGQAKKSIELLESLNRLTSNKDFKKVIEDGLFKEEASRLVLLRTDPSMQDEESQKQLLRAIDSIGEVRQYFITINQIGRLARKSVTEDEQTRVELLAEDVE